MRSRMLLVIYVFLVFGNDSKGARSCRRPQHPPRAQSDAPTAALQRSPFERPGHRHGQCGPVGRAQDAVVSGETAPPSSKREVAKKHGPDTRNPDTAVAVTRAAAPSRHRKHRPIDEAPTQLGDADLLRPIARLL